jgi:hypothetical protein
LSEETKKLIKKYSQMGGVMAYVDWEKISEKIENGGSIFE